MLPPRALILDLGEVLVLHPPAELVRRMAEAGAVPLAAFEAAYWAHRSEFDLAGDPRGYWEDVLRDAGSPLAGAARETARRRMGALDAESWSQYREPVWELALQFRAAGGKTAMLSNCGPEVIDHIRAQRDVTRWFDTLVISWEVGVLKPHAEIYRVALDRLGVAPAETLFVDDRPENVAGARAVGMQAMVFEGDASLEELRRRVVGAASGTAPAR
jgi:putative hydrolase of the HAD superfamily